MEELTALTELLYGPGEPMTGSAMTDDQALKFARSQRWYGEYCLVRQWIWIDLDVSEPQRAELERTRRQPVILYAHQVIYESARRWDNGDFVRTSPLVSFEGEYLFKTARTNYVLLGDGVRKRAPLDIVARIF